MADFYSQEAPVATKPVTKRDPSTEHAKLRRVSRTWVCAAQAAGSRLIGPKLPKGARGVHHVLTVSATLATTTLAVGITGTAAKYGAAATYTAADTPVSLKKAALLAVELAADEQIYITTAVAALPNGGEIISLETFFTGPQD